MAATTAGLGISHTDWLADKCGIPQKGLEGGNVLTAVAALLIGLGTGYNSLLTDDWIEEWRRTQSTWRQILNRVPNLKEGSLLVLSKPDNQMTSVLLGLRHRDVFEPAQLFYGIGYKGIVGATVSRANLFRASVARFNPGLEPVNGKPRKSLLPAFCNRPVLW